jgi:hypothetical protein
MNCIGSEGCTNGQADIYIYPHYLTGKGGKNVCAVANFMHTGSLLGSFVGEGGMNKDNRERVLLRYP